MFRYAICNELYRDWPMERAFAHARAFGYEGIEIAPHTLGNETDRFEQSIQSAVRAAATANGLSILGLHWLLAGTRNLHWTADDFAVRRNTASYLAQLVRTCANLGGTLLVLGSPKQRSLPSDVPLHRGLDNATSVIEMLLPALDEHKIVLCIEPLGPQETNFLNTADQVVEFINRFESPWLRLHLDVKAMTTEAVSIPQIIARHHRMLAHFHANDPNRRGPGMGHVDFVPILRALLEARYQGWVSVEVFDESPGIDALAGDSIFNLRSAYSKAIAP